MELQVNDQVRVFTFKYVTDSKKNWFRDDFEYDKEDRWVLLNKDCIRLLTRLSNMKTTDSTLEDVVQESWIAYDELYKDVLNISQCGIPKEKIKSIYINAVKKRMIKHNSAGRDISSVKRTKIFLRKLSEMAINQSVRFEDHMARMEPFADDLDEIVREAIKLIGKANFQDLVRKARFGKVQATFYDKNKYTRDKRRYDRLVKVLQEGLHEFV